MSRFNKEDAELVRRGQILRDLVESEGWKVAKDILDAEVDKVKFVTTLDTKQSIDDIGKEAYARAKAIILIQSWYNMLSNNIALYEESLELSQKEKEAEIVVEM